MNRNKQEIINSIADEFVQKLTKDYFASKKEQIDSIIKTNDFSMVNRLLDKITLSDAITQEYFDLTKNAKNPVKEVLEPLIIEISTRMFKGWFQKDLKTSITDNIPRYDELTSQAKDTKTFQTTWLRAIAATCNAILADKLTAELEEMTKKKELYRESEPTKKDEIEDQMLETSQTFSNTVTKPFDTYIKNIQSPILLYSIWIRFLYQGLLNIISFFQRNLSIEEKVDGLYLAADAAHDNIKKYMGTLDLKSPEAQQLAALNEQLVHLKANLNSLATEIQDKKDMKIDYQDYAQTAFNSYAQNFAKFIRSQQTHIAGSDMTANHQVLKEVINTLLRNNPILAEQIIERIETPSQLNIEMTPISPSSHNTEELTDDSEEHRSSSLGSPGKR